MTKAAEKAANNICRDFGELEKLQISKKGFQNFVTSADKKAEETIMYVMSNSYPDIPFISEEDYYKKDEFHDDDGIVWIVDPIDGTSNFMRGIPYFAINIALSEKMQITAAVTFDPIRGELFRAEIGCGAFVNNRNRMRVSGREDISESVVAVHMPFSGELPLIENGAIIRKMGSVSMDMAYVASGKFDACILKGVMLWDIASGSLLVREAGGFVKYKKYADGKFDMIASSSKKMMDKMLTLYNMS